MEIFLLPLKLDILCFGIFRKVEDMDDCADIGRGSGTFGEKGVLVLGVGLREEKVWLWLSIVGSE